MGEVERTPIADSLKARALELGAMRAQDRPQMTVMVEFYGNSEPSVFVMGIGLNSAPRVNGSAIIKTISVLAAAAADCNAQAAN